MTTLEIIKKYERYYTHNAWYHSARKEILDMLKEIRESLPSNVSEEDAAQAKGLQMKFAQHGHLPCGHSTSNKIIDVYGYCFCEVCGWYGFQ